MTADDRTAVERQLDNRYQIVRTLGTGAFGAAYLARERDLHRLVAIKVLRADRAWSDDERERLLREARTIANLSHPAVVPLLAYGESNGMVYMVMPYVSGQTLADRLANHEPFDPDEVRRILIEIADALAYVHGEGVLHRDIKPENVLLERAGAVDDHIPPRVRLIDFGVAAFPMRDPGVNAARETWGTPHFMAPEQMFGEPELDPRSEIYSLGVLGFLLLAGRLPFDAASPSERLAQQRKGPVVPLGVCAPDAPKDIVRAIERCIAYDPDQRWR
ncbi:MAG TPA: serine/threonine-protein kinase, partial [Gemmatimonadaceae bacterium]|nr:serine/threonine-protein kinase [Gemmatimonadaceae bacterium]